MTSCKLYGEENSVRHRGVAGKKIVAGIFIFPPRPMAALWKAISFREKE